MSITPDIRHDWTHAFSCGCTVTWSGLSFHKSRRLTACVEHNGRAAVDARTRMEQEAKGHYDLAALGKPMPPFADLHRFEEDDRITLIGEKAMQGGMIAVITDADEGKAERYIAKLLAQFPELRVIDQKAGPTPGAVTVRVCRKDLADVLGERKASTAELLAEHARLMNKHGPDAVEVASFVLAHHDDAKFLELAKVARDLKKALMNKRAEA